MAQPMTASSAGGRPRRFAFVSPNYYPRTCGVGDNTMRFAQELTRRGFETTVFTRSPASPNPEAPEVPVIAASGATPLSRKSRGRRASVERSTSRIGTTSTVFPVS